MEGHTLSLDPFDTQSLGKQIVAAFRTVFGKPEVRATIQPPSYRIDVGTGEGGLGPTYPPAPPPAPPVEPPPAAPPEPVVLRPTYVPGQIVKYAGNFYRCIGTVSSAATPAADTVNWALMSVGTPEDPFIHNYPSAIGYFQDRLIFGGSYAMPNKIWASATGDYTNFILGPADGDAWSFELLSDESDEIKWIAAREVLVIGTPGAEWVVGGGATGITPSNVLARRQTTFGSAGVQGKLINENVVFVQKGARRILEYYYQNELQAYRAADLAFFSDHITEGGIKEIAFQSSPDPILWALRKDGVLLGLTYDKANGVAGWHRHVTDGEIESIAVISTGSYDQLWITVKRTINGSTTRYVEFFTPRREVEQKELVFLDAAATWRGGDSIPVFEARAFNPVQIATNVLHGLSTGDAVRLSDMGMTELNGRSFVITVTTSQTFLLNGEDGSGRTTEPGGTIQPVTRTVTGLNHLEGKEVAISVDGGPHAPRTVSSGTITLDESAYGETIHVGLPYTARIKTMNIMSAVTEALKGRIHAARIRFIQTTQARVGREENSLIELIFRSSSALYGQPAQLFTGEKKIEIASTYGDDQRVVIESDQPSALTVAVILPETGVYAGGR